MSILVYIWSKGWKPLTSLDASFHAICKKWEQKWSWGEMGLVPKQQGRSNPLWIHDMPKGSTVNWYVYPFIYPAYLPCTSITYYWIYLDLSQKNEIMGMTIKLGWNELWWLRFPPFRYTTNYVVRVSLPFDQESVLRGTSHTVDFKVSFRSEPGYEKSAWRACEWTFLTAIFTYFPAYWD